MLAFVCLALAARGVLLGISSATVSATGRARAAATRPIPFSKLFWGPEDLWGVSIGHSRAPVVGG